MDKITQSITLDLVEISHNVVNARQGDRLTRDLIITITNNGKDYEIPESSYVYIRGKRADGESVFYSATIEGTSIVHVNIHDFLLSYSGRCKLDIGIYNRVQSESGNDSDEIASTEPFILYVPEEVFDENDIVESDEGSALSKLINSARDEIQEMNELEEEISNSENNRKVNEATRQTNEQTRQTNEQTRINSENIRNSNENTRKANEVIRESQESDRQTNTATAISNAEIATKKANDAADDLQAKLDSHHFVLTEDKGSANGVAELDENGIIISSQLPSYVDDVIEGYFYNSKFYKESTHTTEIKGEAGKIYIDLSTEKTYRWSGSTFVVISETLALGETSSTAYRGDRGKTAYDHSQSAHARTDATKVEKSSTNGNIKINGTETTVYDDTEVKESISTQSTEILDIKMLGWSVPKECPIQNEVNGNQFIQKVGRVDLGSLNWRYDATTGHERFRTGDNDTPYIKPVQTSTALAKAYSNIYVVNSANGTYLHANDKSISIDTSSIIWVYDTSYTDETTFKKAMQGQYLYYELATPITTTIDGNEIGETVGDVRKETTVNLLKPTLATTTMNGVTFTNNGDGTYTLNGTASADINFFVCGNYQSTEKVINNTGKLKFIFSNVENVIGQLLYYDSILASDSKDIIISVSDSKPITLVNIKIIKDTVLDNVIIKPMITTNLNATYDDFVSYTGSTGQINSDVADIQNSLDGKASSSHSHSVYVNQNAFSNVTVGSTTVSADSATDTLTLVAGTNVIITPDATNDKITISSDHPSISKSTDSTSTASPSAGETFTAVDSVTRDSNGHVTKVNTKTITLPNTTVVVDSELSSTSTNPVQNKVVNSALEEKLSLSGGTLTGDVVIPITKSSVDRSLPVAGSTMSIKDITSLSDYKTYLGTYTHSGAWYNLISIRHRNGSGDGSSYGMYLRSPLAEGGNLTWGKQYGASSWVAERTILDSSNYKTYCTPAKIGAAASSHTHSYAGSSSAGGSATSAVKLDSSAGSATQPVYFSNGKPVAGTYTLGSACQKSYTSSVTSRSTSLITSGGVYTYCQPVIKYTDVSFRPVLGTPSGSDTTSGGWVSLTGTGYNKHVFLAQIIKAWPESTWTDAHVTIANTDFTATYPMVQLRAGTLQTYQITVRFYYTDYKWNNTADK